MSDDQNDFWKRLPAPVGRLLCNLGFHDFSCSGSALRLRSRKSYREGAMPALHSRLRSPQLARHSSRPICVQFQNPPGKARVGFADVRAYGASNQRQFFCARCFGLLDGRQHVVIEARVLTDVV